MNPGIRIGCVGIQQFDDELFLKQLGVNVGVSLKAFGNAFVSFYNKYKRHLKCKTCEKSYPAFSNKSNSGSKYTFRNNRVGFTMYCPTCGNDVPCEIIDIEYSHKKAFSLKIWDLNAIDIFAPATTSAENVAAHIAEQLQLRLGDTQGLYRVSVTEAPGCTAAFYPNDP